MNSRYDKSFPFMRLPPELRSEVYSHLYRVKYMSLTPKALQRKMLDIHVGWAIYAVPTQLLQASRTINAEAEDGVRRVNYRCAPLLVGNFSNTGLLYILLVVLKGAHDQDVAWLEKNHDVSSGLKHRISNDILTLATRNLAIKLNGRVKNVISDPPRPWAVKARQLRAFIEWTLFRLRQARSIDILLKMHVDVSQPRDALSSHARHIWEIARAWKGSERRGLVAAHHVKILAARHIERAVVEDQFGDYWNTQLKELGVTWDIASQDEDKKPLFPRTFRRIRDADHEEARSS